jgi:uncharacterized protein
MQCPKCKEAMKPNVYKQIDYEQCNNCGGLWFSALKAEELVEIEGASQIDTGNLKVGSKLNKLSKTSCPACNIPMLPVHDVEQPHIQLESCPACHGTFFDAGEFKDFCKETLFDHIRDWFLKK